MWLVLAAALMSGYADDAACGRCHADRARTYQHVGMAKSFSRPQAAEAIEDFHAPPFFHEKSGQYFEVRRRAGDLLFRRWQVAADGAPIHVFEQKIDWILGSGHHARTYLYATPGGELYQLPVSWYSQTGQWAMAPGFDRADHEGVTRRVRHECMFCHNAYPAAVPESLSYWRSQAFPRDLPQGIGCQRCHGPGALHVQTQTRESIVNPARLPTRLRNDICYECHMQPTVILPALRRSGRDLYSFRPGQLLGDYAVRVDIDEAAMPRAQRFEINHHPYRLEQSRCFQESEGRLSCLTCHDPHQKITEPEHFRKACLSCHATAHRVTENCVACHMPKRRTQDVVHVVMTDHFIRRTPGGPELLAEREEREPSIDAVETSDDSNQGLYGLIAIARATGGANAAAGKRLEQTISLLRPVEIEPYLDLAAVQLRQRQWPALERTAGTILERHPKQELAVEWLALARAAQTGDAAEAASVLATLPRPEAAFNAGAMLAGLGRAEEAIAQFNRALALRPNMTAAWYRLGEARRECGDLQGAIDAFRRALEIDPSHVRARASMVDALNFAGDAAEAERYRTVATGR